MLNQRELIENWLLTPIDEYKLAVDGASFWNAAVAAASAAFAAAAVAACTATATALFFHTNQVPRQLFLTILKVKMRFFWKTKNANGEWKKFRKFLH